MNAARTHFLGSALIVAMVIVLLVSTVTAVISTRPLIRHADGSVDTVTLATVLRDTTFRGGFVEIAERPRWSEVML